jgi:MFS family permease
MFSQLRQRFPQTGFYGWRMVAAAFAMQFLQAGLLHNAFGAYFAVLSEEFGWSKTALSGAAAMQPMEAAILGPLLGWIIDRFGPQGMIRAGVIIFGVGFLWLSTISTLAGFYAAIIVIALGASLCGYFPLNVAVIRWFERHRARALSFLTLGLAMGGTFVPAVAWSMQTYGWRATAFGSGIIILLLGFPLARVFKSHPSDMGTFVDGESPNRPATTKEEVLSEQHFSAREALRTPAFWLISLGHGFALLVVYAVNVHAITHMRESLGYSVAQASVYITLMTLAQVLGVIVGGLIGDRFDKRRIAALCMLCHAIGLLLLSYANSALMLTAFALIHGTAWGLRGPMMQAIRADYFGSRSIGMILGISSMVIVLGQVGGPMIAAVLADLTGNYRLGFTILAALVGGGSLFFLLAKRPSRVIAVVPATPLR